MIGVVSGFLSKKYLKHPKLIGMIMAFATYLFCRKMISSEDEYVSN
jgi:hypothetical protein